MVALVLVALSVGLDNFGAATALGIGGVDRRVRITVALVFGLFEGGMPIVGILVGHSAAGSLGTKAHLVAGLVLCAAGLYTLVHDLSTHDASPTPTSPGIARLVLLAAVLSLDNLVVGFALGAFHVSLLVAAVVLGSVSALLGLAGLELGRLLGTKTGRWTEALGGIVLVGVGAAIAAGV
jgi:putative Mn2+ efflux pump MntP